MAIKNALRVLASGMVLDRAAFVALNSTDIAGTIAAIRAQGSAPLKVINNSSAFFNSDNMLSLIRAKDNDYRLIAEDAGIVITNDDVTALIAADVTAAKIRGAMKPKYEFAAVPEGWTFATDVSYGPTRVTRKRNNPQGDGSAYHMSPAQIEKLWGIAVKRWVKMAGATDSTFVNTSGGERKAVVSADRVVVGCQTIRRYELEQIAQHKGWAFPQA